MHRTKIRISGRTISRTFAVLGVMASLAFVGIQIHESNRQARAAAYQAVGVATSEFHRWFDARMNRLATESEYPEALQRWSLADWEAWERMVTADMRMFETVLLQVDQGQLPPDAITRLGYNWGPILSIPGYACIWPDLQTRVGASVRKYIEDTSPSDKRAPCKVDLQALRDATIRQNNQTNEQQQAQVARSEPADIRLSAKTSIDGTYELARRIMADGTILEPPSVAALYSLDHGRLSLNLFVKNRDGTIASESTIGRYTFSATRYCEWILYTTRNNLDKPEVTNEVPSVTDQCTPVTSKNRRFNFSPPGEGADVSFGPEGFTAQIGTEFVDHWRKIR